MAGSIVFAYRVSGDGKSDVLLIHTNGALYLWMIDGASIANGYLAIPSHGNLPALSDGWQSNAPR